MFLFIPRMRVSLTTSITIRGVSRCLSRRRRLEIFNFFCPSAAAATKLLAIGGGGWEISIFFSQSAAAA
jgi:hypothetical protein